MKPVITIAICTYNRAEYLKDCIDSLQEQTANPEEFEILVVDNNSNDSTKELLENYQGRAALRWISESQQGLSYARNAAMNACHTQWIFYLDDDAKAMPDMVQIAIDLIHQEKFEIFGGTYIPWYKHGKPYWMKDRYVNGPLVGHSTGILEKGKYLSGGILAIKRNLLKEFGGFHTGLGMKGDKTAYGEETELQKRLRDRGHQIYFSSELIMEHLVAKYKLSMGWYFKSAYARGKDIVDMQHWTYSRLKVLKIFCEVLAMVLLKMPVNGLRLLAGNYYMENFMIDTFAKAVKRAGMIERMLEKKNE